MPSKENKIYKAEENDSFRAMLVKGNLIIIITLLIYNYQVNPFAFTIFILISIYITSLNNKIIVYTNQFIIERTYLFGAISRKRKFSYSKVESISYIKGHHNPFNLIVYVNGVDKQDYLLIKLNDPKKSIHIKRFITEENLLLAVKNINNQLKKTK